MSLKRTPAKLSVKLTDQCTETRVYLNELTGLRQYPLHPHFLCSNARRVELSSDMLLLHGYRLVGKRNYRHITIKKDWMRLITYIGVQ